MVIPAMPWEANGERCPSSNAVKAIAQKAMRMPIFSTAIAAVAPALSRMPRTSRVAAIMTTTTMRQVDHAAVAGAGGERFGKVPADEAVQQLVDVLAPSDRHGGDRDAVLQQQAPADEERDPLAERGVREGVGAAGDRDGAAELGEGEGGEDAGDGGEQEGDHHGGARLGDAVGQSDEDPGADDRPDTEAHELEQPHRAAQAVPFQVGSGLGEQQLGALDARPCPARGTGWGGGSGTHGGTVSSLVVRGTEPWGGSHLAVRSGPDASKASYSGPGT